MEIQPCLIAKLRTCCRYLVVVLTRIGEGCHPWRCWRFAHPGHSAPSQPCCGVRYFSQFSESVQLTNMIHSTTRLSFNAIRTGNRPLDRSAERCKLHPTGMLSCTCFSQNQRDIRDTQQSDRLLCAHIPALLSDLMCTTSARIDPHSMKGERSPGACRLATAMSCCIHSTRYCLAP